MTATIHHGDCLGVLRAMPDSSVHAVITDPPYGLSNTSPAQVAETIVKWVSGERDYLPSGKGFMGKEWDGFVPPVAVWDEAMRVLKPGGHILAFAGTRTMDLMTLGLRLAGFDIRDSVAWLYGSGMPKSHNIGKAIDKRGGAAHITQEIGTAIKQARESRGWSRKQADDHFCGGTTNWTWFEGRPTGQRPPTPETFARIVADWPELSDYAEKVTQADREVIGINPNIERAARSLGGSINFGAGSLNADLTAPATDAAKQWDGWGSALKPAMEPVVVARKPFRGTLAANVLEHGTGAINIDATRIGEGSGRWPANVILDETQAAALDKQADDVSRFFYCAKAPMRERPDVDGVKHPTVKPLALMRWLVRLVTPPDGIVLDPFAGSGTTIEAAMIEGFDVIGIEREAEYLPLIQHRIDRAQPAQKEAPEQGAFAFKEHA